MWLESKSIQAGLLSEVGHTLSWICHTGYLLWKEDHLHRAGGLWESSAALKLVLGWMRCWWQGVEGRLQRTGMETWSSPLASGQPGSSCLCGARCNHRAPTRRAPAGVRSPEPQTFPTSLSWDQTGYPAAAAA